MSSSAILIDLDCQNTSDELAIDYSKLDKVKSNLDLIFELFKTCIEFGNLVKQAANSKSKDMKQWLCLFGEEENRQKTKKYITAICNPEFAQNVKINETLIEKLEKKNFKKELIKAYQIHIDISKDRIMLIQGILGDVTEVKCIIDLEMNKIKVDSNQKLSFSNNEFDQIKKLNGNQKNAKRVDENDEEVIWINDSYEIFQQEETKKTMKLRKSDEINNSFKNLNFQGTNPSLVVPLTNNITDNKNSNNKNNTANEIQLSNKNDKLISLGLHNGFEFEEIQKCIADLTTADSTDNIEEFAFIEYLKMAQKFHNVEKKNAKNRKKTNNKKEMITISPQTKLNLSPSVAGLEPASKKLNIAKDLTASNDCLVIDYVPNTHVDNKPKTATSLNAQNTKKATISEKALDEYANMIRSQEFNEENEKLDKPKRLSKLISAMADDQKLSALHHVNTYRTATSNNNNNINSNMATNEIKLINSQQIRSKFNYDPSLYQDKNSENFDLLFKNFNEKNNNLIENEIKIIEISNNMTKPTAFNNNNNNQNLNNIGESNNFMNNRKSRFNRRKNKHTSTERNNQFKNRSKSNKFRFSSCDKNVPNLNSNLYNNHNNNMNNNFDKRNIILSECIPYSFENVQNSFKTTGINFNNPSVSHSTTNLKYIVIDGSNIAREHGKDLGNVFSVRGIKIVVDYFQNRGHTQIKAMLPRFRRGTSDSECPTTEPELLDELEKKGFIAYTPSRYIKGKLIVPYDDRFILNTAHFYNAIIVSNDNYRDLMDEKPEWRRLIETSLLQYSFIGDLFMVADDPLGRSGPNLDQFLSIQSNFNNKNMKKTKTTSNFNNNIPSNFNFNNKK